MSDNDHRHERYDVYGLEDIATESRRAGQDAREALELAAGLREDLAAATANAVTFETLQKVADKLEQAAAVLRELREDLDAQDARITRIHQRVQALEAAQDAT